MESCGTTEAAAEAIEKEVNESGVQCAVVDYAQLLRSRGNGRYEQVTNTSIILRQLASRCKILLLVLCQLNRASEGRPEHQPQLSDLKDTGQFEQDADVVVFLHWPYRVDQTQPLNKYQLFIGKNRNRITNQRAVICRFIPEPADDP